MATATSLNISFSEFGRTTTVPDDDVARLMYYLNCVTISLGLDILHDDLVDYQNYRSLSGVRLALVFKSAVEFSPDIFIDKLIFKDDAGEIVPSGSSNKFVNITAACDIVSIQRDFIIGGQVKDVTKVMFYKTSWLNTFYHGPVERIAKIILGTNHCQHCEGKPGMCACSTCPRGSDSECKPIFETFLDALMTSTSSSSTARARSPAPAPAPPPLPPRNVPGQHQANCDGCGWQLFTGPRFKCNVCYDYDLCNGCYTGNKHIDTGHHFRRYERPEDSPVYLPVRSGVPPPPPPPYQEATRTAPPPARAAQAPASRSVPPPPPADVKVPLSSPSSSSHNGFFYQNMSITELKSFLAERDVLAGDILDKETLCKRVWETHVDCMSIGELNTFLSSHRISTTGCRDINSRRQKAKEAFEPPARPPPVRNTGGAGGWRKDDEVVLTNLSKVEMNGKRGVVQSVDTAAGKVTVFVEELGKPFKVKYENVKPYVEELGADLPDEPEELE
ncbi:hypothetical protein D9611_003437 [Ephemerocybe angulata]|uniref:ZZ-type domain-containing protein n=1 Tax=Ephemerocybe angulata TaxID=980116 RepID=A0A8H5CAK5_9AGAR|nr:hypothetical protein D9611_003437 [Tulosesus angulatus]